MNEKESKLLFSFTDDIGETATLEKTFKIGLAEIHYVFSLVAVHALELSQRQAL